MLRQRFFSAVLCGGALLLTALSNGPVWADSAPPQTAAAPPSLSRIMRAGAMAMARDDYAAAERLFRRAVAQAEIEDKPPLVGTAMNNLALSLKSQNRFEEAERAYEHALETAATVDGPDSLPYAKRLANLAELYVAWGLPEEARAAYGRAITLFRDHADVAPMAAATVFAAAADFQKTSNPAAAIALSDRALELAATGLKPTDPRMALALSNAGDLRRVLGERETAAAYFSRAEQIFAAAGLRSHPVYGALMNNMGALHLANGDLDDAARRFEAAFLITERAMGGGHPNLAAAATNLAETRHAAGDDAGAAPLFDLALAIYDGAYGPAHPQTERAARSYAQFLIDAPDGVDGAPERLAAVRERFNLASQILPASGPGRLTLTPTPPSISYRDSEGALVEK